MHTGTPQLQCLSVRIRQRVPPYLQAYHGNQPNACLDFHNLLHVPQLRTLDLQDDMTLARTAGTQLGSCLARLEHLQASLALLITGSLSSELPRFALLSRHPRSMSYYSVLHMFTCCTTFSSQCACDLNGFDHVCMQTISLAKTLNSGGTPTLC